MTTDVNAFVMREEEKIALCSRCDGTGAYVQNNFPTQNEHVSCPLCGGLGRVVEITVISYKQITDDDFSRYTKEISFEA